MLIKGTLFKSMIVSLLLIIATVETQALSRKQEAVFDTIMSRIRVAQLTRISPALVFSVDSCLSAMSPDGTFSDVDYANTHATLWKPQLHLNRIRQMVSCYIRPGNKFYEDPRLFQSIVNGMRGWYEKNPKSSNWWHNQIAVPQTIGVILIGMRDGKQPFPSDLEQQILIRIAQTGGNPQKQTGANKVDVAIHYLYRGCLQRDTAVLSLAVNEAFYSLRITTQEGIQPDGAYFQHGQQLYIGGYGRVLIDGVVNVARFLIGTPYALSGERLDILSTFVRDTYLKSIRGQYHLFNVLGRGMTRRAAISQSSFVSVLQNLKKIDVRHADDYDEAIARLKGTEKADFGLSSLHKHYWRGDYTLHQRPEYSFDLRMVSTRTARNENGNDENLNGYFLSDGGTDIAVDGDEYASIIPVWDWSKIPGTTAPEMKEIPLPKPWSEMGKTVFAGGVSDGKYGVSAYVQNDSDYQVNTFAHKSWFFFDKEIVCLGAGIHSSASQPITTSVNQCALKGDVIVAENGKKQTLTAGSRDMVADWVWHNRIAYFFPTKTRLSISNQTQTGSWYDINRSQPKETVRKEVFSLWINHGSRPVNGQYAYIVIPAIDNAADLNEKTLEGIDILSQTDSIQVVRHKKLGLYSLVFFKAGLWKQNDVTIRVSAPCILMIRNIEKSKVTVYVADPLQGEKSIEIGLKLPGIANEQTLLISQQTPKGATQTFMLPLKK